MGSTSPSTKPTIFLVHGGLHNPSCWADTQKRLEQAGYPSSATALLSPGSLSPGIGPEEDIAAVRKDLEALVVDQGKDVVVVMHSYGGMVGGGAIEGLEKKRRQQRGEKGGVVACLFIAAFILVKGKNLTGLYPEPPAYVLPLPSDPNFLTILDPHEIFYNDVSREVSHPFTSTLRPQPVRVFEYVVKSGPWESGLVPCTYLLTERDQSIPPSMQEQMLEDVKKDSPKPWAVERVDAAHSVWLSKPEVVVDLIQRVADGAASQTS